VGRSASVVARTTSASPPWSAHGRGRVKKRWLGIIHKGLRREIWGLPKQKPRLLVILLGNLK
jgi:hypothetical protein